MDYLIFVVSMSVLIYGAEVLIKESEKIALHFNISHFVIGASLIALGTSLPEFAASVGASLEHKSDMAVSNVLGSVMLNIALVLGVVFLLQKELKPSRELFDRDSAWIFLPVGFFILVIFDGVISRFEGFVFLFFMVAYLIFLANDNSLEDEIEDDLDKEKFNWAKSIVFLLIGFVLVIKGADYTVESASNIARSFGVSEWLIGLFLLAFGTSLPELIVSIKAALKGNAEMSIGNIIGSNVANFSIVLGGASMVNPLTINMQNSLFDIVAMVLINFAFIFILANKLYNRATGVVLLAFISMVFYHAVVVI